MDKRPELLRRVRDDAAAITELIANRTNVPLEQYVDKPGLNALCDSFGLEGDEWQTEDLERILIIRDGLYELRNKLRDAGDEAEHSVEQILSGVDRLYADLERAFRELNQDELKAAQTDIAALQRGPHITSAVAPKTIQEMQKEASEVLVQAHTSIRHIEVNLLKIDRLNVNFEVLRNMRLSVQRLSASVFAIKLSLEQTVIYQGIFKLLTDGADRIVEELKTFLQQMKSAYLTTADFVTELTALAERGTRFTRLVAEFLRKAFAQTEKQDVTVIELKIQSAHQGGPIFSASADSKGMILMSGRGGNAWNVDASTGKIAPRYRLNDSAVNCITHVNDTLLAMGTDAGLEVQDLGEGRRLFGSQHERVISIAIARWGAIGSRGTIITGSRDGIVRRWTLAGGLNQFSDESYEKVGRNIHGLVAVGDRVIAATGVELVILDEYMRTVRTMRVPFEVAGMDAMNEDTLILCGKGNITHVNLTSGLFARVITASDSADYTCVARYDSSSFLFGTRQGKLGIMDFASGEEIGYLDSGFQIRGLLPIKQKVFAYGGDLKLDRFRSAVLVIAQSMSVKRT